jgi:hypothetical protein
MESSLLRGRSNPSSLEDSRPSHFGTGNAPSFLGRPPPVRSLSTRVGLFPRESVVCGKSAEHLQNNRCDGYRKTAGKALGGGVRDRAAAGAAQEGCARRPGEPVPRPPILITWNRKGDG